MDVIQSSGLLKRGMEKMKQREQNENIYIQSIREGSKVHIQKPGGYAWCGARLRNSIKSKELTGVVCENCLARMEGKKFGTLKYKDL